MMMGDSYSVLNTKRALILCPHTDDEYGCAGTMVRLVKSGARVRYVALSRCEESVPPGYPKDILVKECRECTEQLGLHPEDVDVWDYPVRNFPFHRQQILQNLFELNRDYNPDLVILPTSLDTHQDHMTIYAEGFRAFKHSSILGYELPQNLRSFENTAFVKLSKEDLQTKINGLSCYQSQLFRRYSHPDFIKSLAMVRGVQCDAEFAEAFELIRLII